MKPKFARVPVEVLTDKDLKDRDIRVYGVLSSLAFWGNAVSVSVRELSEHCGCSRMSVARSLDRLVAKKHINYSTTHGQGKRSFYVLTSKIFGAKQGKEDVVVRSKGGQRYASMDHDRHGLPAYDQEAV